MDAVDDASTAPRSRRRSPRAVLALVAAAAAGARRAALAGRAGAARRRRRLGAGRGAGAARARRWPPSWRTARSATLDPEFAATADPDALRAVGVLDTFALVRADDPDELDVDAADEWADAVLDRLPAGRPAAGVAAADRGPRPRAGPRLAPRRCRCSPRLPPTARADVLLGGVRRAGLPALVAVDAPGARRRAPRPAAAPGQHGATGTVRTGAAGAREVLELLRPPATVDDVLADVDGAIDLLDRLGDPARTVRPDVLRTVYARLAAALDGIDVDPPERVRVAPDRVVEDAVVLDAPYLQPLVDRAGRAGRRRARAPWPTCSTCRWPSETGRRDGRPAAGAPPALGRAARRRARRRPARRRPS